MKKIVIFLICAILLISFGGCNKTEKEPANTLSSEQIAALINPDFSDTPYGYKEEGESYTTDELKDIISKIPTDKYEEYPTTHNVPLSVTLHKNGETISIDVDDARVIGLVNLFNNCVYYSDCSYVQGLLPLDFIEDVSNNDFRLELKYTPYGDKAPGAYSKYTTNCDTIIITNSMFTLLSHHLPGYEGDEDNYPFRAVGYNPLSGQYPVLDLFGF